MTSNLKQRRTASEVLLKQGGHCALCEGEATTVCHKNGYIQGILCPTCCSLISFLERPEFIKKAIKYIEEEEDANKITSTTNVVAC